MELIIFALVVGALGGCGLVELFEGDDKKCNY